MNPAAGENANLGLYDLLQNASQGVRFWTQRCHEEVSLGLFGFQ